MKYKNNPLNIRKGSKWLGLENVKSGFCEFKELEYGIRTGYYLLFKTYLKREPFLTLEEAINIFCPVGDGKNDPDVYLRSIFELERVPRSIRLNCLSLPVRAHLLRAMCIIETHTYLDASYILKIIHKYFPNEGE